MERISTLAARWIALALGLLAAAMPGIGAAKASPGTPLFAVDTLVHDADRAELRGGGWLVTANPAHRAVRVQIDGAGVSVIGELDPVRRPDVVQALSRPEVLESGWQFAVKLPPEASLLKVDRLAFLDASGALILEVSEPQLQISRPDAGALRHLAFALGVVGLLVVALVMRARVVRTGFSSRSPAVESRSDSLFLAALVLASAVLMSVVVPPFQSPDEFDHVERAYLLGKGQWLLDSPDDQMSGGEIDRGLLEYMAAYSGLPFHPENKVEQATSASAQSIAWAGQRTFDPSPGTGYYLPLAYVPQAFALAMGEALSVSVDASYRLARLAGGAFSAFLLFAAFRCWRPGLSAIIVLLLPMTLFQWAGAGIDAFSLGATALAIALWSQPSPHGAGRVGVVAVLVVAVVGCRIQLAPLLLLPLLMLRPWRPWRFLIGLMPAFVIVVWVLIALAGTQDTRVDNVPVTEKLGLYVGEPGRALEILWNTVTTPAIIDFYARSFVGVLGWLDTALPAASYSAWYWLVGAAAFWGLTTADWRGQAERTLLLSFIGLLSALFVPLLLLLVWTPLDATTIEGVQGRYFVVPALVMAMAVPPPRAGAASAVDRAVSYCFASLVALYALVVALPTLVARYYG